MNWLGDYPEDFTTVAIYFTTHDGSGAAVAPLTGFEAADVIIYKNGSATQKTTTNGLTMTSPFDSIVGLHCLVIDTSNNTGDTGFWVGGAVYTVVLSPDTETVNGQTVVKVVGSFSLSLAADAFLDRDMSLGTDSGSSSVRTPRQALRILRNKVSSAAGTMTVTKEDDSTSSWTAALTTDAAAQPIVTIDPA